MTPGDEVLPAVLGAGINHGDVVVIRKQCRVEIGENAAAMVRDEETGGFEATVKEYRVYDGYSWLIPHSPAYPPIPGDKAKIIGKVKAVLRGDLWRGTALPGKARSAGRGPQNAVAAIDAPLCDDLFGDMVDDNAEGRVIKPRLFGTSSVTELVRDAPLQAAAAALLALALAHRATLLAN